MRGGRSRETILLAARKVSILSTVDESLSCSLDPKTGHQSSYELMPSISISWRAIKQAATQRAAVAVTVAMVPAAVENNPAIGGYAAFFHQQARLEPRANPRASRPLPHRRRRGDFWAAHSPFSSPPTLQSFRRADSTKRSETHTLAPLHPQCSSLTASD